eukprot:2396485-Pleurochrysis_carterae.AAC.1
MQHERFWGRGRCATPLGLSTLSQRNSDSAPSSLHATRAIDRATRCLQRDSWAMALGAAQFFCKPVPAAGFSIAPSASSALCASASLDDVLTPFGELSIGGADFKSASWCIRRMGSSILTAAAAFNNLRPLESSNPLAATRRLKLQFDGMSWTRGHGCTRLIVRTQDLRSDYDSPMYSRDVLKDLTANFRVGRSSSIHAVFIGQYGMGLERENIFDINVKVLIHSL